MENAHLQAAVLEARKGLTAGGIPIGSVLVYRNTILGRGHNQRLQQGSVVLHAEMDALENAGRLSAKVYAESTLYTTLSPCHMCAGAVLLYGIPEVIIGENVNFMGAEQLLVEHGVTIHVLQDSDCIRMMSTFIEQFPEIWSEDIGC